MDTEGFDVYPILHKGRVYNIVAGMDMTFREVHAMLDWLAGKGAFPADGEQGDPGEPYSCPVEGYVFDVDVQGYEVAVYRRKTPE